MPRSDRHTQRCDHCGRFMPWARWTSWNCFAGYDKAWCDRTECDRAAVDEGVIRMWPSDTVPAA